MGNEISIPAIAVKPNVSNTYKKSRKYNENSFTICALPTEIWFEILAFVKFYEAPNIFLVNRDLLQICQVYFHSGTVGPHKYRNVRDVTMQLMEGSFTILVECNAKWQSVPMPEVDPPKIFNSFGKIKVKKCCRIQAMQFLCKFQSLLTKENIVRYYVRNFFVNDDSVNVRPWFWQCGNSNPSSSIMVDERQSFLNLIGQKKIWLQLENDPSSESIARCLADEPLIAQFNGSLSMVLKNERNLCGLEEDAKFIYGWISSAGTRQLDIEHYDAQKAMKLARRIVSLFEQAHINKNEAEKMDLAILLPEGTVVPMLMQKIYNGKGEQLATLRTFSAKCNDGYVTSAYVFYTKSMEYLYENENEMELLFQKGVFFL